MGRSLRRRASFQHTAARRRLACGKDTAWANRLVSTHSRPKAAGTARDYLLEVKKMFQHTAARRRLAASGCAGMDNDPSFNTQPPEGGWQRRRRHGGNGRGVSTHSRPKAAGSTPSCKTGNKETRFNTQPPEGGWQCPCTPFSAFPLVSTHSRPKAAGITADTTIGNVPIWFQHTAARRRLASLSQKPCSIRFRSPDFARLPRKARVQV